MAKKYFLQFILFMSLMIMPFSVFAQGPKTPTVEDILPKSSVQSLHSTANALPVSDFKEQLLPQVITLFLGVVGTVSFIIFMYAGVNLVISQGNEEEMTKFKTMLVWAVVGLILITMSFVIIKGVLELNFEV